MQIKKNHRTSYYFIFRTFAHKFKKWNTFGKQTDASTPTQATCIGDSAAAYRNCRSMPDLPVPTATVRWERAAVFFAIIPLFHPRTLLRKSLSHNNLSKEWSFTPSVIRPTVISPIFKVFPIRMRLWNG